jgi:transposase-like protein
MSTNMPLAQDKYCTCGRENALQKHCPSCGARNCYALKRKSVEYQGVKIRTFYCRSCDTEFTDATKCEAPFRNEDPNNSRQGSEFAKELEGLSREEKLKRIGERLAKK